MFFFPEKDYDPKSETSWVYWAARTKNTSFPLSKNSRKENLLENVGGASNTGKSACSEKANRYEIGKYHWNQRGW